MKRVLFLLFLLSLFVLSSSQVQADFTCNLTNMTSMGGLSVNPAGPDTKATLGGGELYCAPICGPDSRCDMVETIRVINWGDGATTQANGCGGISGSVTHNYGAANCNRTYTISVDGYFNVIDGNACGADDTVTGVGRNKTIDYYTGACTSVCGNGVVESGEQCDAGGNNGTCPAACSNVCTNQTCTGSLTVNSNVATSWTIDHGVGAGSGTNAYYGNLSYNTYTITVNSPANYSCTPDSPTKQINAGAPNKTFTITCTQIATTPTVDLTCLQGSVGPYFDGPCSTNGTGNVSLKWVTGNSPTSCTASAVSATANWTGAKAVGGSSGGLIEAISVGTTRTYSLSCTNASGTTVDSVVVSNAGPPSGTINTITGTAVSAPAPVNTAYVRNVILGSGVTTGTLSGTITGGSGFGYGVQLVVRRGDGTVCNDWNGSAWTSNSCVIDNPAPTVAGNTWSVSGSAIPPYTGPGGPMTSGETYKVWANFGDGAGAWSGWKAVDTSQFILFDNTPPVGTVENLISSGGQLTSVACPPGSPFSCGPGTISGTFTDPIPAGTRSTGGPLLASGVIDSHAVIRQGGTAGGCSGAWNDWKWNGSVFGWSASCSPTDPYKPVLNPAGGLSGTWTHGGIAVPPAGSMTVADNYYAWFQPIDAAGNGGTYVNKTMFFQPDRAPYGSHDSVIDSVVNGVSDAYTFGWSIDKETPAQSTRIDFYLDGQYPAGTYVGYVLADQPREPAVNGTCTPWNGVPCPGNHGFAWAIPNTSTFRNGVSHSLFAYGITTSPPGILSAQLPPIAPLTLATGIPFIFPAPTVGAATLSPPDYCDSTANLKATINWTYSDISNPAGLGATPQAFYQVQIDHTGTFTGPFEWDTLKTAGSVTSNVCNPQQNASCKLTWDTKYWARVKVWDGDDNASAWSAPVSWKTPKHAYPGPVDSFGWAPQKPEAGETITFNPGSIVCWNYGLPFAVGCPAGPPPAGSGFTWTFGDNTAPVSGTTNPQKTYPEITSYNVNLTVTDLDGYSCSFQKSIKINKPIPWWKEVLPGKWQ